MKCKLFRENVEDLINDYFKKHKLAKELGGEYINQNDKAQIDAIELVSNICNEYVSIFGDSEV